MASIPAQRGNTLVGFILGLVVGLLIALVVAVPAQAENILAVAALEADANQSLITNFI